MNDTIPRRLPIGAEYRPGQGTHFRVWAPVAGTVDVVFEGVAAPAPAALRQEEQGYFSGVVPQAGPGTRHK